MYTKTVLAAAAVIAQAAAFSSPACWSSCFAQYNIDSEGCLCSDDLEEVVGSCISTGCAASNMTSAATQYASWVSDYCGKNEVTPPVITTEISTHYTTVCPVTETSSASSYVKTTTSTVETSYTTSVTSWSTVETCITKTSTWTSSGSTATSTWSTTVTKTPGYNTWTGTKSVPAQSSWSKGPVPVQSSWSKSPVAPTSAPAPYWQPSSSTQGAAKPTGTGSYKPTGSSPVPYTGAANMASAGGLFGVVAVAAAGFLL